MTQTRTKDACRAGVVTEAWAFDLDGTLLDTLEDLANSVRTVLVRAGWSQAADLSNDSFRQLVGSGISTLFHRIWEREWGYSDPLSEEQLCTWIAAFHEEYKRQGACCTRPYPGVEETLDRLLERGALMVVLTNKPQQAAQELIETFLPGRFQAVLGLEEGGIPKPDPQNSERLLRVLDVPLSSWTMVGDSDVDIWTAQKVKMRAVGASWGFRGAEELRQAGAQYIVERPEECLSLPRLPLLAEGTNDSELRAGGWIG